MVKIPSLVLAQERGRKMFQIFERIESQLVPPGRLAQPIIQGHVQAQL